MDPTIESLKREVAVLREKLNDTEKKLEIKVLGVAGVVTCNTELGHMIGWFYRWRILSRKARDKV